MAKGQCCERQHLKTLMQAGEGSDVVALLCILEKEESIDQHTQYLESWGLMIPKEKQCRGERRERHKEF